MVIIVVLDAGPLGLASNARGKPETDRCHAWLRDLAAGGIRIVVPEIADYEVRRELLRVGATAGIRRLDRLLAALAYEPITTEVMRRAAEFWAQARRAGIPTAAPHALDADVILAAQASLVRERDEAAPKVIVATTNVGHLARFVAADRWDTIEPPPRQSARMTMSFAEALRDIERDDGFWVHLVGREGRAFSWRRYEEAPGGGWGPKVLDHGVLNAYDNNDESPPRFPWVARLYRRGVPGEFVIGGGKGLGASSRGSLISESGPSRGGSSNRLRPGNGSISPAGVSSTPLRPTANCPPRCPGSSRCSRGTSWANSCSHRDRRFMGLLGRR